MLPHTGDFTRTGCTIGTRLVTYAQLTRYYVCNECGGAIVHHIARQNGQTVDWAECGNCHGRDFVSARFYDKQVKEFPLVVMALAPELRNLIQPNREHVTAEQAIADLYG